MIIEWNQIKWFHVVLIRIRSGDDAVHDTKSTCHVISIGVVSCSCMWQYWCCLCDKIISSRQSSHTDLWSTDESPDMVKHALLARRSIVQFRSISLFCSVVDVMIIRYMVRVPGSVHEHNLNLIEGQKVLTGLLLPEINIFCQFTFIEPTCVLVQ